MRVKLNTYTNKKNTMIVSAYGRYTTNVTVRQQSLEYSEFLGDTVVVTSYQNASSSQALGLEFVSKNSISKSIDISTNINVYNSAIDGTNLDPNLKNNISSYWIKSNITYKAPKNISFQVMFDYSSKRSLEVGSSERGGGGGGGGGMGMGGWGGSNNTVQGYIEPTYGLRTRRVAHPRKHCSQHFAILRSDYLQASRLADVPFQHFMEIWKDGFAVVQAQEHEVERRRDGRLIGGAEDVAQDWRSQRCFTRCGARLAEPKMFHKMLRKITS